MAESDTPSESAFSKLAHLIEDIKIDRYGKPLMAALHLCNDLANELAAAEKRVQEAYEESAAIVRREQQSYMGPHNCSPAVRGALEYAALAVERAAKERAK